jgi:GR25 family glycosyltransferase involved in LPS biosynthesis
MDNKIEVFILTLKGSNRIQKLKKRLKEININYRVLFGINGNIKKNHDKLKILYNKKKTENYIGRPLAFPEIAASYAHINAYKIIKREKIKSAIIMEDDVYPSKNLGKWIKNKTKIKDNFILSFYAYSAIGFIFKKAEKSQNIMNNIIKIHVAKTHLYNASCYQINLKTCEKILEINNNKVCGFGDWQFNLIKNKIKLGVTLPYLNILLNYKSNTALASKKFMQNSFNLKNKLSKSLQDILRIFYYLSFLPFLIRKYKNFDFYYEYFFSKYLCCLENLIFKKYLNTSKIFYNKNFYSTDLKVPKL